MLATTDYVFKVNMSTSETPFREQPGITCHIMFPLDGKFEVYGIVCTNKIAPLVLTLVTLDLVLGCQEKQILACICILPE